ncbi:shikimate kinase AroL [uncultured Desulfosarcina sp.]|uniref:shikimate kinase AroL n=1 Tax=uncultured Desulfosarcina sp. TaxID=218289 RepID=UPI0029C85E06|nr:shikimate kinase AroL [uncultured Desulfosarcina sp.]
MNLFLIGYRCTGKTTVGKALARRLGWSFVDTDRMIAATSGTSIARMVDEKGWTYFREQERQTLKALSADDRQVVATGGGIILDKRNVSVMRKSGTVVLLTASRKTIAARMLADDATEESRPSLTGQGLVREIMSVLGERLPLYEKASDFAIDTNRKKIEAICDRIIEQAGLKAEAG